MLKTTGLPSRSLECLFLMVLLLSSRLSGYHNRLTDAREVAVVTSEPVPSPAPRSLSINFALNYQL